MKQAKRLGHQRHGVFSHTVWTLQSKREFVAPVHYSLVMRPNSSPSRTVLFP